MKKTIIILWRDSAQLSADEDGTTQYGIIYDKVGYCRNKGYFFRWEAGTHYDK